MDRRGSTSNIILPYDLVAGIISTGNITGAGGQSTHKSKSMLILPPSKEKHQSHSGSNNAFDNDVADLFNGDDFMWDDSKPGSPHNNAAIDSPVNKRDSAGIQVSKNQLPPGAVIPSSYYQGIPNILNKNCCLI